MLFQFRALRADRVRLSPTSMPCGAPVSFSLQLRVGNNRQDAKTNLGISHCGCRIVIDAAEVAVALDQRRAHHEVLSHAHQRVVHGSVTWGGDDTKWFVVTDCFGCCCGGGFGCGMVILRRIKTACKHRRIGKGGEENKQVKERKVLPKWLVTSNFPVYGLLRIVHAAGTLPHQGPAASLSVSHTNID